MKITAQKFEGDLSLRLWYMGAMEDLYQKLQHLLKTGAGYLDDDGELNLTLIQNKAYDGDADLLDLLLGKAEFKRQFFTQTAKALIFKRDDFIDFITTKQFLANSYTKYKNKIGLGDGRSYLKASNDVVLMFPFKDCVLEGGMSNEETGRKEIFYNETLAPDEIDRLFAPKMLTNAKRINADGEQEVTGFQRNDNGRITDNLLIKGNNLIALHSLKKQFAGKVKLIYIDPPYNTQGDANTFQYNNSFNHSTWLTFMKNRLEVAKTLLKKDGIILVAIDDEEQAYLRVLMDESFGRDNFLGTIIVQSNPRGRTTNAHFATCHEYCHVYAKDVSNANVSYLPLTSEQRADFKFKDSIGQYRLLPFRRSGGTSTPEERPNSFYPIYYDVETKDFSLEKQDGYIEILPIDSSGKNRVWRQTRPSLMEAVKRGDMVCKGDDNSLVIYMKDRIKEGRKPKTIWHDSKYDASANGTMLLKKIFDGQKIFSYPKSIYTILDTLKIFSRDDDIILDFFAGSGTTAHAVLELNKQDGGNRQFILCEQMDYIEDATKARIQKVIQNNATEINFNETNNQFIYAELAPLNQTFIDAIHKTDDSETLLKIRAKILQTHSIQYNFKSDDELKLQENYDSEQGFKQLTADEQKQILIKMLDKNQLYVNYSERTDEDFKSSDDVIAISENFYDKK